MKLDRYKNHDIEVVIDKLVVSEKDDKRLKQSVATAMQQGEGLIMIYDADTREVRHYSKRLMCPVTGLSYKDPALIISRLTLRREPAPVVSGWGM